MKKISVLLCGIGISCILAGCGNAMPELTEEENDVITEYAVGLLLKYDKNYNSRLIDLTAYEEEQDIIKENAEKAREEAEKEEAEKEESGLNPVDTEVVDIDEEVEASTIEEFYGIDGVSFQYTGYDLNKEYPEMTENEAGAFFAMQATPGMQLLVLKFQAVNLTGADMELNMLNYGTKFRVAINGEAPMNALSTMLLNDIQTYKGLLEAGSSKELVAIVEAPEGTYIENASLILRNDSDSATIPLQ